MTVGISKTGISQNEDRWSSVFLFQFLALVGMSFLFLGMAKNYLSAAVAGSVFLVIGWIIFGTGTSGRATLVAMGGALIGVLFGLGAATAFHSYTSEAAGFVYGCLVGGLLGPIAYWFLKYFFRRLRFEIRWGGSAVGSKLYDILHAKELIEEFGLAERRELFLIACFAVVGAAFGANFFRGWFLAHFGVVYGTILVGGFSGLAVGTILWARNEMGKDLSPN